MKQIKPTDYPFAWLDEVVEVKLNPAVTSPETISAKELESLSENMARETREIENKLKAHAFALSCKSEIQAVVEHYYITTRQLQGQVLCNLGAYADHQPLLRTINDIKNLLEACCRRIGLRYRHYLPESLAADLETTGMPAFFSKMLVRLSGDQIGILIRAAYEGKLIDATSKRAAYKFIAPFLSTEFRSELSDDSLRSNANRPETKDLDVVVAVLRQLIEIISDYYRRR